MTGGLLQLESAATKEEAAKIADTLAALALALPAEPLQDGLRERIAASLRGVRKARSAVLVIDMLNDHLTPGLPLEVARARAIVPALVSRLDAARAGGVPVVYIVDQHEPGDPELEVWPTHNVSGTKGNEVWPPLAPKAGDTVVTKPSYSAFVGSKLDATLDGLGVDTLVLTGCLTEVGILATAMDALQRGYAVVVPPDAQAGSGPVAENVAMTTLSMLAPFAPARRDRLARAVDAGAR